MFKMVFFCLKYFPAYSSKSVCFDMQISSVGLKMNLIERQAAIRYLFKVPM